MVVGVGHLVRDDMDLGSEHGPLSAEHQGIVASAGARAVSGDSAKAERIAEPSPVLPGAMPRQNPSQQIPEESWAEESRLGSNLSTCPFQLFVAPGGGSLASSSPLPALSSPLLLWLVASVS